jgi:protein SCO1
MVLSQGLLLDVASAYDGSVTPPAANEQIRDLEGVGITEMLGTKVDLNLLVTREDGQKVPLSSFFDGTHPVIISPVYFSCPGLCNFHLNGLVDGLKEMDWSIGQKFKVLAFSFDSKETAEVALKKKDNYLKVYGRDSAKDGFHFLTADEATVQALTKSVGFKFKWSNEANEWAHASAAIVMTPAGVISRYHGGVAFDGPTLKMSLNEAASGKIGSLMERVALFCYQYDPHQSKYTLASFRIMQLGGGVMILLLALWLLPVWFRAKKVQKLG